LQRPDSTGWTDHVGVSRSLILVCRRRPDPPNPQQLVGLLAATAPSSSGSRIPLSVAVSGQLRAGRANGLGRVDGLGDFGLAEGSWSVLGAVSVAPQPVEACQRWLMGCAASDSAYRARGRWDPGRLTTLCPDIKRAPATDFLAASYART